MISRKEISEEFNRISTFKNIMETYEEIAASRMQNSRVSVINSRNFVDELNSIFQQVKSSYRDEVMKRMHAKNIKDPSKLMFNERNGKTLYVLLSSNTGLYGDIVKKTCNLFSSLIKQETADAAIIGKVGLEHLNNTGVKIPYTYFEMPDSTVNNENLKKIIAHIIQYERVFVVYGRFQNVITQEPVVTSISGDALSQDQPATQVKYFFEPSLDKILQFFEAEIFASFFEQTIYESQLAKFASRMTSLEMRVENIQDILKGIISEREKVRHRIMNKKQLETFSSMALWR